MLTFEVGVIIPAAGSGERLGSSIPKQYCKVLEKPLFLFAVEQFLSLPWIKKIALVVDNVEKVCAILQETGHADSSKLKLVRGGPTRHRSIYAGLQELERSATALEVVVVHDGVRPFAPPPLVSELCEAAAVHGAAGAVRPLVSTVLGATSDQFLGASLDRSKHVASETPQAFRMPVLVSTYRKCTEDELDHGTECLQLVLEHAGVRAKLIPGPEDLWKVTYRKDLYTAVSCLRERNNEVCIISEEESVAVRMLEEGLSSKVARLKRVEAGGGRAAQEHGGRQKAFNTVVLFHVHEIQQDEHLLDFASLLDTDKQGLIVHVIENARVDGMQGMSVYSLHRSGRRMAHRYDKLRKGVVVVHCVTANEERRLADLVVTLVQADPATFSGQTFFL